MSRWFRFYDDALNDPKVQRLEPKLFKAWVNILCLASKNDGLVPCVEDVAFALRVSDSEAGKIVDALIASGLIDEMEGRHSPHNWNERQFKSDSNDPTAPERQKRYRDKKRDERNADRNGTVTVTPTRTDTETEQINAADAATPVVTLPVTDEARFFRRFKEVCGENSGGMAKQLLKAKGKNPFLAISAVEMAATKGDPREYIGAIIRGRDGSSFDDLRKRGEAW